MQSATKEPFVFKKQYLPGYTGFVPEKNHLFAMTAGEINKKIIEGGGSASLHYPSGSTHALRFQRPNFTPKN